MEEALKDYTKAIELGPRFHGAYKYRGTVNKELGNIEEAIKDWEKAIELYPRFENELRDNINEAKEELE